MGLSLSLRATGADAGVGVHVVCPGLIDTPVLDNVSEPGLPPIPSMTGVDARAVLADIGMKKAYPADRCTTDILRGVARNRPIIVVPRQAQVQWLLLRLSSTLADKIALQATRTARKHSAPAGTSPLTS